MALHRRLMTLICRVMVGVVVFAQLAVTAYACPSSATWTPCEQMGMSANGAMPGNVELALDDDMPNLCVEHCRFGQQSADAKAQPQLPPAMATPLYALPTPGASCPGALSVVPRAHDALATPPHAILHCVLRI
jgi:hypothetical protein